MHINNKINVSVKAVCRVVAKKLLNKAQQIHREHAGSLLQAARLVQSMELTDKNDFGDGCHMASTEPFFDVSAYKLVKKEYALPIDTNGRCITAKNVCTSDEIPRYSAREPPMKWECSSECKIISDSDVCTIIDLDIISAGGAWIFLNEQRGRDTAAKKKELIQVESGKVIIIMRISIYMYLLTATPTNYTYTF